jgi:uncharacterized protein YdeI (YjbR/CyaY-like superfamily)
VTDHSLFKRGAELIEQGRMTEAGLDKIDEAKQNGEWGNKKPAQ